MVGEKNMETEITVQVYDKIDDIIKILESKGFKVTKEYTMIDYYYSKYDLEQLKKMTYQALIVNSFLLRNIITDKESCELCYKNKIIKDNVVVSEQKQTTKIDSFKNAVKIFENSGITMWCEVQNHSFVYRKSGICFALQIIKDLGVFIEYEEDSTMQNLSTSKKIERMKEIVNSLGLKLGNDYSEKKVYRLFKNSNK